MRRVCHSPLKVKSGSHVFQVRSRGQNGKKKGRSGMGVSESYQST